MRSERRPERAYLFRRHGRVAFENNDRDLGSDGVAVLHFRVRSAHLNGELLHVYLARLVARPDDEKSIVKVTGLCRVEHEIVIILARVDIALAVADRGRDRGHERLIILVYVVLEDDLAHNIVGGDSLGVIGVELPRCDLYLIRIDRPSEGSGQGNWSVQRRLCIFRIQSYLNGGGVSTCVFEAIVKYTRIKDGIHIARYVTQRYGVIINGKGRTAYGNRRLSHCY